MPRRANVMSRGNGNKWRAAVTHRDVLHVVEEIGAQHKLLCNFRVEYAPAVVTVIGQALRVVGLDAREVVYVAKHSQSPLHAPPLESILYRVAWDLYQQADAGAAGFVGSDSLW
jgi:hypothetical protein